MSLPAPLRSVLLLLRAGLLWLYVVVVSFAALSLCVRVALAWLRTERATDFWRVALLNKTMLVGATAAVSLGALLVGGELRVVPPARRRAWLASAVLLPWLVAGGVGLAGPERVAQAGLMAPHLDAATGAPAFAPNRCYREQRGPGPAVDLCTNADGRRGPVTLATPRDGRRRVALVGDSFVFGSGVAEGGTLDVALDRALAEVAPTQRWQVLNLGMPGLTLAAYVRMLQATVPRWRPEVVVVGFLAGIDLGTADPWHRQLAYGPAAYLLSAVLLIEADLYAVEQAGQDDWDDPARMPAGVRARRDADLAALRALQDEYGFRVLVYAFHGETALLDPLRGDDRLVVTWPRHRDWATDPRLHIAGDGHPTAAGNAMFAREIAEIIGRWPAAAH